MFQTFISRHNSNFFSDKLALTSVTPASSAPVLQTPKATSSTLYFDSLTVNAGNGGFLHCIQMDTSVNAANQVVSVGADIAFAADPKFFACLVRFESSAVPTALPTPHEDYGGSLRELARLTDGHAAGLEGFTIRQVNFSELAPGAIKAFHLHVRQTDVW